MGLKEIPTTSSNQLVEALGHFIADAHMSIPDRLFEREAFVTQLKEFVFEVGRRINGRDLVQEFHKFTARYLNLKSEVFIGSVNSSASLFWNILLHLRQIDIGDYWLRLCWTSCYRLRVSLFFFLLQLLLSTGRVSQNGYRCLLNNFL